jgi:hypothetical protein
MRHKQSDVTDSTATSPTGTKIRIRNGYPKENTQSPLFVSSSVFLGEAGEGVIAIALSRQLCFTLISGTDPPPLRLEGADHSPFCNTIFVLKPTNLK